MRPADVVGTWIAASFGPLGMNKQIFTFLLVGDRLRGVVCGRCDNTYTIGAMENIVIVGDTLYFDIVHEDWGEIDPPTFRRNIGAQLVQNEMIAFILGKDLVIDPAKPPARPAGRGFTLVGPIAPEGTRGTAPRASTSGDQARAPPSSRRRAGRRSGRRARSIVFRSCVYFASFTSSHDTRSGHVGADQAFVPVGTERGDAEYVVVNRHIGQDELRDVADRLRVFPVEAPGASPVDAVRDRAGRRLPLQISVVARRASRESRHAVGPGDIRRRGASASDAALAAFSRAFCPR